MSLKKDIDGTLDHVAVVVRDMDQAISVYEDIGLKFSDEREVVESQGVLTAFAPIDTVAHIELLMPHGEDGPIHQYLKKRGEGIHHLCFKVSDVAAKTEELKGKGYRLIYEAPVEGANNCLVNFVHPKSTNGVLIELSQKQENG